MAKFRPLGQSLDITKRFAAEDGKHFRGFSQDIDPAIRRAAQLREINHAPKSGNPNGWRSGGVVPMSFLMDFLHRTGYTMDQFARNEGGAQRITFDTYHKDPGVKAQFFREFFTRDNAKLHSQHVTTKRESSQIFTGD